MTNPNLRRAVVFVVPSSPGVDSLAVQVAKSLTNSSNGVEYQAGQVYGFEKDSALSIVINNAGKGFCFDDAAAEKWLAALMPQIDEGRISAQGALNLLAGPGAEKARADKAALHDAMEGADALLLKQDEEAKAKAEAEAKAKAIEAEAEARAEAERQAEAKAKADAIAAQEKANNDANERQRQPVDPSRTVSNANVSNAELENGTPPPAPAAPKTSPRRGR